MRRLLLIVFAVILCACRGTQPYTAQDLADVKRADATIEPIYLHFKQDYLGQNSAGILHYFRVEQAACRQVDVIDKRDTIDPNVNLFQASAGLDNYCNAIESAYVYWAKHHGYPYDKSIVPGRPSDVFLAPDDSRKKMHKYLERPDALS